MKAKDGKKPRSRTKAPPLPHFDVKPEAGTVAWCLYDAITTDARLAPIVVNPGEFALRIVRQYGARIPATRLVNQVHDAGLYLARTDKVYTDGCAFLRNQFQELDKRVAREPKAATLRTKAPPVRVTPLEPGRTVVNE